MNDKNNQLPSSGVALNSHHPAAKLSTVSLVRALAQLAAKADFVAANDNTPPTKAAPAV